jgi:hypothetical protein
MKMEIYKLQVSQYAHTDNDNDSKSDISFNSNLKSYQQTSTDDPPKPRHPSTGFDLPPMDVHLAEQPRMRSPGSSGNLTEKKHYDPTETKKSLVSVGKSVVDAHSIYSAPLGEKTERNKEKQKILSKLE